MRGQALADHGRFLEAMEVEVELLTEAARRTASGTPVRMCPGWTVGEVVRHVGSVYRVVLSWLAHGRRPREWQRDPAPGQSVEDYLREGLAELTGELARHDPGDRAATWWPADPTYGFWRRRMAHETTIHRVDVQDAAGVEVAAITDDIAIDGVDEALTLWFGQRLPMLGLTGTRPGLVAVRSGGHTWIARAGPAETVAWRCSGTEADQADATVSGAPQEIYLWLWGRGWPGSVIVDGDDDAAGQLWALMRLATR
ncbi:maleylpyruvate isomerase family mycothiol-dependent enzyme [Qaidamihabitans albus]|uniref:maleylpyruvate isomerase family mycothiol-dependent enzyme n=1 Tax=Qaidamihabitans albus TaxID=2795733 RepID=UPI0018F17C65|nr:maleylpyruvate isomerase family mycothiol-dependent enzyme [Qaidamihabitans albus]